MYRRCKRCGLKSYPKNRAQHAALAISRGKPITIFPCPDNGELFHLRAGEE